jgi:hypothetical protein
VRQADRKKKGCLTAIGTGYQIAGHITPEAEVCIRRAEKLFHLFGDPVAEQWLQALNPTGETLRDCYVEGKDRSKTYREIVNRVLKAVRRGLEVCLVTYGHPGVFAYPIHEAVRQAKRLGFRASMLPGISAADCLYADLGVDPSSGCQMFEATDFLIHSRKPDPTCALILWQIGLIGVGTFQNKALWSSEGLSILSKVLAGFYSPRHKVVVYEAPAYPILEPLIHPVSIAKLPGAPVTIASTLYVPPKANPRMDRHM